MTEAEARELLRRWPDDDGLEGWIAEQSWQAAPGGWTVTPDLQGWRLRIEVIAEGLRISGSKPGAPPTVWTVPRR